MPESNPPHQPSKPGQQHSSADLAPQSNTEYRRDTHEAANDASNSAASSQSTAKPTTRRDLLRLMSVSAAAGLAVKAGGSLASKQEQTAQTLTAKQARNTSTPPPAVPSPPTIAIQNKTKKRAVRNIILMISDGMSMGVPSLAEPFSQSLRGTGTHWHQLLQNPKAVHGLQATDSASGLVTDSSAAGSAFSSGHRIPNGMLNMDASGKTYQPMATYLQKQKTKVGVVSTDSLAGATPSSFACISENRNWGDQIVGQYLGLADVALGGGREKFDGLTRRDGQDLMGQYAEADYQIVLDRDTLLSGAKGGKDGRMLGIFNNRQLPYTIDHRRESSLQAQIPTLAEMTRSAITNLDSNAENGFFLMVEGARIDHAAHHNDAAAMYWEQLAFDDAIGVAKRYVDEHPDTLLLITSDHGNANPGLNGMGSRYSHTNKCFEQFIQAKHSFVDLDNPLHEAAKSGHQAVNQMIESAYGFGLNKNEAQTITTALNANSEELKTIEVSSSQRAWTFILGQALGNYTGVMFTSHQHTQDHVLRTAYGPTSEQFAGIMHHVDTCQKIKAILGVIV